MNPMTEDLPQDGTADNLRPAASLTSNMIKRRRAVRVATPEDVGSQQAEATVKAAQELAARVEAAFPGDAAPDSTSITNPPPAAEKSRQNGTQGQADALQARQQELRRLAAERAEAQRRPLNVQGPSENMTSSARAGHEARARRPETPPAGDKPPPLTERQAAARPQARSHNPAPARQNTGAGAHDIQQIDSLRNGRGPSEEAPGARRKSLVRGGMTALERRRTAVEHHRKLTEAQAQTANAKPRDVATYWDEMRRGRQVPSLIDIDPQVVAEHWPNSLLISCDDLNGAATLERSFAEVMRSARERASANGDLVVEYTPMVTEWIMTVGREVARAARPIQDIEVFPTSLGNVSYRVIALPLSGERLGTVHALCYISHA